jgi:hypothetical protein
MRQAMTAEAWRSLCISLWKIARIDRPPSAL